MCLCVCECFFLVWCGADSVCVLGVVWVSVGVLVSVWRGLACACMLFSVCMYVGYRECWCVE